MASRVALEYQNPGFKKEGHLVICKEEPPGGDPHSGPWAAGGSVSVSARGPGPASPEGRLLGLCVNTFFRNSVFIKISNSCSWNSSKPDL